jgi:hypothetical protein
MLHHELRPGKQHCQEGTPQFIVECVEKLKTLGLKGSCLIRLDSGNDAEENFAHFGQESYTGFVEHLYLGGAKSSMCPVAVAFEVIERLSDADGNHLLIPTIEVNTY